VDGLATGRAGHAARPNLADNALYRACRDVLALEALAPHLPGATLAVTMLQAGERHNVIPGEARFTVDLRTSAACTSDDLVHRMRAITASELRVRSDRFRAVATPGDAAILAAARSARPGATCFTSPTLSDWAHLAQAGAEGKPVPAIKWGPGRSEVSHTADEWVEIAMIREAAVAYRRCIEAWFAAMAVRGEH
jgi:acetylornithine deacetylase